MIYKITRTPPDELRHHGIKGQEWGVRRGPPYPIEDKTMKKGTHIKSVSFKYTDSDKYKSTGRPLYTYNADDEYDNKVYKGPFAMYNIMTKGAQFVAEHEYEVVKDLHMPTKKERIDEFKNLYNSKQYHDQVVKDMTEVKNTLARQRSNQGRSLYEAGIADVDYEKVKLKDLKTDAEWEDAYKVFKRGLENPHEYKSTSEYMKKMASKYDAMVDDNDQSRYNDAHDPVIIFRANEALKSVGGVKMVDINEILSNFDAIVEARKKKGKAVVM